MIRNLTVIFTLTLSISSIAKAGGAIGGGSGAVALELADEAFGIRSLSPAYAQEDDLRRARARLSTSNAEMVSLNVVTADGSAKAVQAKMLLGHVVDQQNTLEILPSK